MLTYESKSWTKNNAAVTHQCSTKFNVVSKKSAAKITVHRITNEDVLRRAEIGRKLCVNIRERQARFFGHFMRRDGWKNQRYNRDDQWERKRRGR